MFNVFRRAGGSVRQLNPSPLSKEELPAFLADVPHHIGTAILVFDLDKQTVQVDWQSKLAPESP
jgi:hypothetical protein